MSLSIEEYKLQLIDKLKLLSNTQESIQTLSYWIRFHAKYSFQRCSVEIWKSELFREEGEERKLLFLYLANDLLQESRKRGEDFLKEFTEVISEALLHVWRASSEEYQKKILRLLDIWDQRKVFAAPFIQNIIKTLKSEAFQIDTRSNVYPDSMQEKLKSYEDYQDWKEYLENTSQLISQSLTSLPLLSESEEAVKEIAPNCVQFTQEQQEDLSSGDTMALNTLYDKLVSQEELLLKFKSQIEADISLTHQLIMQASLLVEQERKRIASAKEGLNVAIDLLGANKALQAKFQNQKGTLVLGRNKSKNEKKENKTEVSERKVSSKRPRPVENKVVDLEEYKRRKVVVQTETQSET